MKNPLKKPTKRCRYKGCWNYRAHAKGYCSTGCVVDEFHRKQARLLTLQVQLEDAGIEIYPVRKPKKRKAA